jgi:Nuclease A inhibitor-like protein
MNEHADSSNLVETFQQAVQGLLVISESDYPIEVSQWQGIASLTPEQLLKTINQPSDSPIEIVELQQFFAPRTQIRDWHGDEEKAIVQRFQNLVKLISETLTEVKVYRVGAIEISVYIVGRIVDSAIENSSIVLSTKVIET